MTGYLRSDQSARLRSEMLKKSSILSLNYSKRCKLFIFPKDYLKETWLNEIIFTVIKEPGQRVDLLFCLIMKLSVPDDMDHIPLHESTSSQNASLISIDKSSIIDASMHIVKQADNRKIAKKVKKDIDLDDIKVSGNRPVNKLKMLLSVCRNTGAAGGTAAAEGEGFVDEFVEEQMMEEGIERPGDEREFEINTPLADRRVFGNPDSSGRDMNSHQVRKQLGVAFERDYDKDPNSDQKMYTEKYDEFEMQAQAGDIMNMPPAYEDEGELRFSEEGNNSPTVNNRFIGRKKHTYDEYADGFGTMLNRGTHDYDPMSQAFDLKSGRGKPVDSYAYDRNFSKGGQVQRVPYNPEQMSKPPPSLSIPAYGEPQKRISTEDNDQLDYTDILEMNDGQDTLDLDDNR